MNTLKAILVALILAITTSFQAQTADEIITNYFENVGGQENWAKVESFTMKGVMKMQGMEILILYFDVQKSVCAVFLVFSIALTDLPKHLI